MPIKPVQTVLHTEAAIDAVCERAKEQIMAKVLEHYRKHPGNAWSGHYLVDLEKTVKTLYRQMGVDIGTEFRRGLPKTMREFYDRAAQEMAKAGRRNALLGAPDTGRVNYFLNSGFEQVAMRTTRMSFDHIKQLRTISADVLRTASLTGETRAQVTKEMLARAAEIPGFKFTAANGAVWKDQAYFKMLARTELMNAGRAAYDDKCAAEGCDVVMLDYSGNCCEACGKWEGQLFSLTGATPGLPTKAELEADGVFHPNCTHSYSAVPDYVQKTEFNPDGKPKQAEMDYMAASGDKPAQQYAAPQQGESIADFTPAKTMKEAIAYTKEKLADSVDATGLTLPALNALNGRFAAAMGKYGLGKFARMEPGGGILGVSRDNTVLKFEQERWNEIVNEPRDAYRRYVTKPKKLYGQRLFAFDNPQQMEKHCADHETGHLLFNRSKAGGKEKRLADLWKKHGCGKALCLDAQKSDREFLAEAFAIYERGGKLDSDIVAFIEEVLK